LHFASTASLSLQPRKDGPSTQTLPQNAGSARCYNPGWHRPLGRLRNRRTYLYWCHWRLHYPHRRWKRRGHHKLVWRSDTHSSCGRFFLVFSSCFFHRSRWNKSIFLLIVLCSRLYNISASYLRCINLPYIRIRHFQLQWSFQHCRGRCCFNFLVIRLLSV
jgi:hypothetical protein